MIKTTKYLTKDNNTQKTSLKTLLEELNVAIKKKDFLTVRKITEDLPINSLTKGQIVLAINSQEPRIANLVFEKANYLSFDKQIIEYAINTNNPRIVELISEKTNKTFFDKNILINAIHTKNYVIVDNIIKKTDKYYFDKEVINESLRIKDKTIFDKIAHNTPPKVFDEELLKTVIKRKDIESIRSINNYIEDKELLLRYRTWIQHSILKESSILNLTGQILNLESNISQDKEMQELVLDMYLEIVKKYYKHGAIPKSFDIKSFEESIKESRYFFSCPHKINFSSLYDENQFLILPIITFGHVFSAVVRKQNDNKISVTFVNLGNNFYEKNSWIPEFKEYIFSKENALKILKGHSYNVRLYPERMSFDSKLAYERFENYSLESFPLYVTARQQKVGNCFIKNIEKGIRYALSTQLTKLTLDNFEISLLRKAPKNQKFYKVKFLKPLINSSIPFNDTSSLNLKKALIITLIKKFPAYKREILIKWNYYKSKKLKNDRGISSLIL